MSLAIDYRRCPVVGTVEAAEIHYTTPDGVFRIVTRDLDDLVVLDELMYSRMFGPTWQTVARSCDTRGFAEALNIILYPPGSEPSPEWSGRGIDPRTVGEPDLDLDASLGRLTDEHD